MNLPCHLTMDFLCGGFFRIFCEIHVEQVSIIQFLQIVAGQEKRDLQPKFSISVFDGFINFKLCKNDCCLPHPSTLVFYSIYKAQETPPEPNSGRQQDFQSLEAFFSELCFLVDGSFSPDQPQFKHTMCLFWLSEPGI